MPPPQEPEEEWEEEPVVLGLPMNDPEEYDPEDMEWTNAQASDPYCSRLGGTPVVPGWAKLDLQENVCELCGRPLAMLMQAHMPVGDNNNRLLIIMACNYLDCHKADPQRGWKAWRLQAPTSVTGACKEETLVGAPYEGITLPMVKMDDIDEPEPEEEGEVDLEAEYKKVKEINANSSIPDEDLQELNLPSDKVFLRFLDRRSREPRQVVRWHSRELAPLWVSKEGQVEDMETVPRCEVCKADRRCELQLLPSILYFLDADGVASQRDPVLDANTKDENNPGGNGLDFGIATLYTCSDSCDSKNCWASPEYVHVQKPVEKDPNQPESPF